MTIYNEKWYYSSATGNQYGTFYIAVGFRTNADGTQTNTQIKVEKCVQLITTGTWYANISWESPFTGTSLNGEPGVKYNSGWVSQGMKNYNSSVSSGSYTAGLTSYSGVTYETVFSSVSYTPYKPAQTPDAPTIGTNTRVSDGQNTITWTNSNTSGSQYAKGYDEIYILRSTSGGPYAQINTISFSGQTSFTDITTNPNHYYSYKIAGHNGAGTATSSASSVTYNTPSTPTNFKAVYNGSSGVNLSWTDKSFSEDGFVIQSANEITFANPNSINVNANVTSYTDTNPPMGTAYYRIKAKVGNLSSSWSTIVRVTTLTNPAVPTIVSPSSSAVLDMPTKIRFEWVHNSLDGTSQSAYKLYVSTTSASSGFTEYTGTTAQYREINITPTEGTQYWWYVKTKGTYSGSPNSGYSEPTQVSTFYIKRSPTVTITQPVGVDGQAITDVPVVVAWNYSDTSGTQSSAEINITNNGNTVWSGSVASATSVTIPVSEFLPENNKTFTVSVTASSTSTLQTTTTRVFVTDYDEPNPPALMFSYDLENASITATVNQGTGESQIATTSVGLFAQTLEGEVAVAANMTIGSSVTYLLPPLNVVFQLRAVAYSQNGLTASTYQNAYVEVPGENYWNYGSDLTSYCHMKYKPSGSPSYSTNSELIQYVGDEFPTAYEGSSYTGSHQISGSVFSIEHERSFMRGLLSTKGSRCFYRDSFGGVYPVSVSSVSESYSGGPFEWQISVSQGRVM